MFRYYTTPETRQALIAESNRLIAGRRQAAADGTARAGVALDAQSRAEIAECGSESAFARLVADLQSTSTTAGWPAPRTA